MFNKVHNTVENFTKALEAQIIELYFGTYTFGYKLLLFSIHRKFVKRKVKRKGAPKGL